MQLRLVLLAFISACTHNAPPTPAYYDAKTPAAYYVIEKVQVYLSPSKAGAVTNRLYRQQRVDVYEVRGSWARISKHYNWLNTYDKIERVAQWVLRASLSPQRPPDLAQPTITKHPRIAGIPEVGKYGLTLRDVQILHAAARYYLETKRANFVIIGDKSVKRPGYYYLGFTNSYNHFFKPSHIPDLEQRIARLGR